MSNENHNQINDLIALLSPGAPDNPDAVQKEPLTYHRRGHWFKSNTALALSLTLCHGCVKVQ